MVSEALPVLAVFLCGFAGWAAARSLKRRLGWRLESHGLAHKKIDDEPEARPAAATETTEPSRARPPAGPSPTGRRPTAPQRRARRCPQEESRDQPAAPLAVPARHGCLTAPGQLAEPAEQATPTAERAEAMPESERVTRLLAKKAARKARKALERQETAQAEQERPPAATERQEVTEAEQEQPPATLDQQEMAKAADAADAEPEQPAAILDQQEVAETAEVAEAEWEQPAAILDQQEAAEAEREQLPAVAEGHTTRGAAGEAELVDGGLPAEEHPQDDGAESARMLWAAQEIERGEWKESRSVDHNKQPMRAEHLLAEPPTARAGPYPEDACYTQYYHDDDGSSRWNSSWLDEQRGGSWGRSPGRRQGSSWRGEAGPALQELDSWMTPFDNLCSKPAPPVPLLQQPVQAPVQASIVGPMVCPDGHTAFCDGSRVYTPVGGSGSGVFTDGEQTYEMACFQVELPLQVPGDGPGLGSGAANGLLTCQGDEFDPYDPAGLAPPDLQEQQWKSCRAEWSSGWGSQKPGGSWNSSWDPSW